MIAELKENRDGSPSKNRLMKRSFLTLNRKPRAQDFEERLSGRIVGQERAVRRMRVFTKFFWLE